MIFNLLLLLLAQHASAANCTTDEYLQHATCMASTMTGETCDATLCITCPIIPPQTLVGVEMCVGKFATCTQAGQEVGMETCAALPAGTCTAEWDSLVNCTGIEEETACNAGPSCVWCSLMGTAACLPHYVTNDGETSCEAMEGMTIGADGCPDMDAPPGVDLSGCPDYELHMACASGGDTCTGACQQCYIDAGADGWSQTCLSSAATALCSVTFPAEDGTPMTQQFAQDCSLLALPTDECLDVAHSNGECSAETTEEACSASPCKWCGGKCVMTMAACKFTAGATEYKGVDVCPVAIVAGEDDPDGGSAVTHGVSAVVAGAILLGL